MGEETKETDSTQGLEESWNDARATLLKSLGEAPAEEGAEGELSKASQSKTGMSSTEGERLRGIEGKAKKDHPDARKAKRKRKAYQKADDEDDYDVDDDDEDEDEEEEERRSRKGKGDMGKSQSFSELMSEDEDAEDSMDAVPFLKHMVKSLSKVLNRQSELIEDQHERIDELEGLVKSHARFSLETSKQTEQLQKSFNDYLEGPVHSKSAKILSKGRFKAGESSEMSGAQVLAKSHEWVVKSKIDVNTAGRIEHRVNKGTLFQQGDELDQQVQKLIAQEGNS